MAYLGSCFLLIWGLGVVEIVFRMVLVRFEVLGQLRRVRSTPDPNTFEKYRNTPPSSIAILLQKYALLLPESGICTTNLYCDTAAPICIAILSQKCQVQGSLEHHQVTMHGTKVTIVFLGEMSIGDVSRRIPAWQLDILACCEPQFEHSA